MDMHKLTSENRDSILGISFDGLATSGIVNELLNVAAVLRQDNDRVLVDLGRDIAMSRTMDFDNAYFPAWVEIVSCLEPCPEGYTPDLVQEVRTHVVSGISVAEAKVYDSLCREMGALLVKTFRRNHVRILIVENGTLPDNPVFTEALYLAIAAYGAQKKLGKYVLWRDHDLMWSTEPHLFGSYPYPGVRKPFANPHIHYALLTEWMRQKMQTWAPNVTYHVMPNRFFSAELQCTDGSLRSAYGISKEDYLVSRCTRVVPQKSIERDLRLLDLLQRKLRASGNHRRIFLFITGPINEDPAEFRRLRDLAKALSVEKQIIWANGLLPFSPLINNPKKPSNHFSIRDLLAEADLNSFLTTYDYEGFGNPPGEAMAMNVPFISTTYELYHEVYGSKGVIAPLLMIDQVTTPDASIPDSFTSGTLQILTDDTYRQAVIRHNKEVCHRFFSLEGLKRQLHKLFPEVSKL
jgi:glycosyltransferase involved in cell wall biosynthesis